MMMMSTLFGNSIRARAQRRAAASMQLKKPLQQPRFAAPLSHAPQQHDLAPISQAGTMLLPVLPLQLMQAVVPPPSPSFEAMRTAEVTAIRDLVGREIRAFYARYRWLPEEVLVSRHLLLSTPEMQWEYFPVDLEDLGCFTVFLRLEASLDEDGVKCVGLPGRLRL